ncbi:hypothetical protein TRFO_03328 [Tritrichomonas foetus]|uniref:Uncharacterized protein n=1 Tax=Tritrichomonas foetus TaxID=1144522 RepID=A0A1J4KV05_9EUKA|nr:hypothetical protein TRFO_03328 [Tritrichomonas foetus]|eukprot:OHT13572.1 hypothetical protein TRFO_03328 [Tritrichomonas foetus]
MSRHAKLVSQTRKIILDLADNNKKRWSHFTGDAPLTFERFCQRLVDYKITKNPDDANFVWKRFNCSGKEMQFRDFICFLQSDDLPEEDDEPYSGRPNLSPTASLFAHRRDLIDYFLALDPNADGYITQKQLSDFAVTNQIVHSPQDLSAILNRVNPSNSSTFNYYLLMYEISQCKDDFELNSKPSAKPQSPFERQDKSPAVGGRGALDPSIFGESSPSHLTQQQQQHTGARRELDESIFGEKSPKKTTPQSNARKELDPSIFGEKAEKQAPIEQPTAPIDLSNARDCTDYNEDQTISLIARFANSKFRSLRDCFGTWRGNSDRLTWDDIYRGMVNDAKIEVSPEVVEALVNEYGGELTMSSFTRFISAGARINEPEPVREAPPPLTERDILLNKIATGLKGKPSWEISIKNSKNSLDLVRNLKKFGINMKSEELRSTFEELGMKKIVDEIKHRQAPPKKRGAK